MFSVSKKIIMEQRPRLSFSNEEECFFKEQVSIARRTDSAMRLNFLASDGERKYEQMQLETRYARYWRPADSPRPPKAGARSQCCHPRWPTPAQCRHSARAKSVNKAYQQENSTRGNETWIQCPVHSHLSRVEDIFEYRDMKYHGVNE